MEPSRLNLTSPGAPEGEEPVHDKGPVEELMRAFSTALRSYRLYEGNGPVLQRFLDALGLKLAAVWRELDEVKLEVEEKRIFWEGQEVYPSGDSNAELAFLFYRDGIRELTLFPGIEEELGDLLEVLARAPQLREQEDDLVTVLWEKDFSRLKYEYVELAVETVELPEPGSGPPPAPINPADVQAAVSQPSPGITPDDFQETLYFLDQGELRRLAEEVRRENERDLWGDVVKALFDRLEDGTPERQVRILGILGDVLPSLLAAGQLGRAAHLLGGLVELAGRPGLLPPPALREVRALFAQLASAESVGQLVQTLEDAPATMRDDALVQLLGFFPPEAIVPLMRATETVTRPDVRRMLESVIQRLASDNREQVADLLADADPAVVAAGVRWIGRLGVGAATSRIVSLLANPDAAVRLAAVEALPELRASAAAKSLEPLLEDPEREVRIAAARSLVALGYTPARPALEAAIQSKRLRAADRTEKIAFFEAYGQLAGADGVAMLDRTLNGRSWLGKGETPEIRACAALALARIRHPSARAALTAAANDSDPVVKSAVARALREESA